MEKYDDVVDDVVDDDALMSKIMIVIFQVTRLMTFQQFHRKRKRLEGL